MPKIGVLFDIDELGGGLYGYEAYKIFFAAVDTREIVSCLLSDGDTNDTLFGTARHYCIAVDSLLFSGQVEAVRNALSSSKAKGLLPLSSRFLSDAAVIREPLVPAGRIDTEGNLLDCQTGWVRQAWEKSHEQHPAAVPISGRDAPAPARSSQVSERTEETVHCSNCRKELSQLDVGLAQAIPDLQQWFGNVCVGCKRIYCANCLQLGGPTPCPVCGLPTKPAQRVHLREIGALARPSSSASPIATRGTPAHGTLLRKPSGTAVGKSAPLAKRAAMTPRERWIGIFFLILALALFEVAVQTTLSAKQTPSGAIAALDVSLLLSLIGSGYVVHKKGRRLAWAFLGLLNWIGIIAAFCLKNNSTKHADEENLIGVRPISKPPRVVRINPQKMGTRHAVPPPAHRKLRLPPIGPEFLGTEFTTAEEPSGPGTAPFWEALQCSKRDEFDKAERAFLDAVAAGVPPTCESYANCEIGKLALAKGQLERGIDYLLRCLVGARKSASMALDAAMRLQVIYAEAGRIEEANAFGEVVAAANTRGLELTREAEEKLRILVRSRQTPAVPSTIRAA